MANLIIFPFANEPSRSPFTTFNLYTMLARTKVSRPETSPHTPLPQHTSGTVLTVQRQTYTQSLLDKHEKLRRLGEAATDVFCAGVDAVFDKIGTQSMSQRMHSITKSVQNSCGEVFQVRLEAKSSILEVFY